MRRPIVTKRSTANANTEKSIPPAMPQQNQHLTPTPCCESLRQQHPNNSRQHGALAKIGNMQAGLETFNQQPCSPESCHSVTLARVLLFVSCAIFRKKGHCSNLIFGAVNTLAFWTPRSSPLLPSTQRDPQSCRVRSLGGRRGEPKNKQHIKRPKEN